MLIRLESKGMYKWMSVEKKKQVTESHYASTCKQSHTDSAGQGMHPIGCCQMIWSCRNKSWLLGTVYIQTPVSWSDMNILSYIHSLIYSPWEQICKN